MFLTNKWNQLALFLLILGVNMIIFSFLAKGTAQLIWHSQSMDNPAIARYTNSITLLGIFGITALLYAFIINRRKPFAYLKMDKGLKWNSLLLIILILCASMPALSWIIKWNESLHLPQVFSSVEQKMRQMEDSRAILTKQMLAGTSLSVLFANLLAMAIVPAICEELFFRGVLLSWLKESFHNKHLAVWLSAIVFSAIHIQFFGFFPRMLLGVYLGYLFLWTGSLWTAIIAHFLNNAIAIAAAFLYNIGCTTTDYQQVGNADEKVWAIALSCCFTTTLIWYLWKNRCKNNVTS
jgi:membrane protease YdiL (CAAX protease family)